MRKTLSFIFLFIALITQATTVKVSSVYTEQMSNPLGLDTTTPRFQLADAKRWAGGDADRLPDTGRFFSRNAY